jgi:putative modified peptide
LADDGQLQGNAMAGPKKTAPIDVETAERLLELLGTDDGFRQKFQENPSAALESIGYSSEGPESMAASLESDSLLQPFSACSVMRLASKDQILAAKDELTATLVQGLAYNTPTLEAETLDRRTRK